MDFREGSAYGVAPELKFGEAYVIRTLADVKKIPTEFDFAQLVESHRDAFPDSNVKLVYFVNVMYVVYRFIDPTYQLEEYKRQRRKKKQH